LSTIEDRVAETTALLIPKMFCSPNQLLQTVVRKAIKQRRTYRYLSTIRRCAALSKEWNIATPTTPKISSAPPWLLRQSSINCALQEFPKNHTNGETFRQLFYNKSAKKFYDNRTWIFTDATKSAELTAFACVDINGKILSAGSLPEYYSVFSAEAEAILKAIVYAQGRTGKFTICTDSLSTVESVKNIYV